MNLSAISALTPAAHAHPLTWAALRFAAASPPNNAPPSAPIRSHPRPPDARQDDDQDARLGDSPAGSVYGDLLTDTLATQLTAGPGLGLGRSSNSNLRRARAAPRPATLPPPPKPRRTHDHDRLGIHAIAPPGTRRYGDLLRLFEQQQQHLFEATPTRSSASPTKSMRRPARSRRRGRREQPSRLSPASTAAGDHLAPRAAPAHRGRRAPAPRGAHPTKSTRSSTACAARAATTTRSSRAPSSFTKRRSSTSGRTRSPRRIARRPRLRHRRAQRLHLRAPADRLSTFNLQLSTLRVRPLLQSQCHVMASAAQPRHRNVRQESRENVTHPSYARQRVIYGPRTVPRPMAESLGIEALGVGADARCAARPPSGARVLAHRLVHRRAERLPARAAALGQSITASSSASTAVPRTAMASARARRFLQHLPELCCPPDGFRRKRQSLLQRPPSSPTPPAHRPAPRAGASDLGAQVSGM